MEFLEAFKRLEKRCNEMYHQQHGVTAYIDEMTRRPRGADLVPGWTNDLKQLKHYRWVRNQITHEENCTEKTMCEPGDAEWLNRFCDRILKQSDPLALYRKERNRRAAAAKARQNAQRTAGAKQPAPKKSRGNLGWALLVASLLLFGLAAIIITVIQNGLA